MTGHHGICLSLLHHELVRRRNRTLQHVAIDVLDIDTFLPTFYADLRDDEDRVLVGRGGGGFVSCTIVFNRCAIFDLTTIDFFSSKVLPGLPTPPSASLILAATADNLFCCDDMLFLTPMLSQTYIYT